MSATLHLGYLPGCIGRVVGLHGDYYHREWGHGVTFEAKVARGLADFCLAYDDTRDGLWLAMKDGQIEGSIAIDGSHAAQDGAHLRWFICSDALRGSGMGNALVTAALDFCRAKGYRSVHLDTFAGLNAARHLYEKHGFRLTHQQPGTRWGVEVQEQVFELTL